MKTRSTNSSKHVLPTTLLATLSMALACALFCLSPIVVAQETGSSTQDTSVVRSIGTIKAINGNTLTVVSDAGAESDILVDSSTSLLRTEPGSKTLKDAKPIQLTDLAVGDRVVVRGKSEPGTKSITALTVIALKKADLEQSQQQQQAEWQKHGVGGIVQSVDPAAHTVTINVLTFTGSRPLLIHVSDKSILRRYAPDSVKFSDAKVGTLDQIHSGDQLRARGTRSEDGKEFTADELVSGAFRNIAGPVTAVNAASNSLTVQDVMSKKSVTVNVTPDSQLRNIPPMLAQRIAMRFRNGAAGGVPGGAQSQGGDQAQGNNQGSNQGSNQGASQSSNQSSNQSGGSGGRSGRMGEGGAGSGAAGGAGGGPGGGMDFQQILSRMPAASINDLKKGDVVMLVATQGASADTVTAITLLSGVDTILAASPTVSQASLLTPWNLSAPSGDASP